MLYLVQTIADNALDLANMRNNSFIDSENNPTSELMRYLNMAYSFLYSYIARVNKNYYTISYDINVVAGQDTYDVPEDLLQLEGVDMLYNSTDVSTNNWVTCDEYMFNDRNKGRQQTWQYGGNYIVPVRYRLIGTDEIKFVPIPSTATVARLWYTPKQTDITSYDQEIHTIPNGDSFMAYYSAICMKQKEESDASVLINELKSIWQSIIDTVPQRSASSRKYVIDVYTKNYGAILPFLLW